MPTEEEWDEARALEILNEDMMAQRKTVWVYDQGEKLKVFATEDAAQKWFDENDPAGVAFEYPVEG